MCRVLRKLLMLAAVFSVGVFASGCVMAPALGVKKVSNVVFTRPQWPKEMRAHVYLPEQTGPRPAVLLLHGGGLADSGGRWQMAGIAGKLARHGYVVVNSTYRTVPKYKHPVPLDDVREALRWMRGEGGAQYGIDPTRVAVFGYSAGGYLASLAALTDAPGKTRVKAIVTGGAPSDMVFYSEGILVPEYLGALLEDDPERFWSASPVYYVNRKSPPIFIYHGSEDRLVKPEHPLLMREVYRRAGIRCETRVLWGRGHISAFLFSNDEVDEAVGFLDGILKP